MMNYNMLDMFAEDVNAPEIANPIIWSGKHTVRKALRKVAVGSAAAVTMMLSVLTTFFTR